ncbi:mitochondrial escape protein 2, partial [Spiromyces aspiralis]
PADPYPLYHEAAIYLDNVYPLKFSRFDFRPALYAMKMHNQSIDKSCNYIPENLPFEFRVKRIVPRLRDGGTLMYFQYKEDTSAHSGGGLEKGGQNAVGIIVDRIRQHLVNVNKRKWFNFNHVRAFRVLGDPFDEDIMNRYPSSKLKVSFSGPNMTVEQLFSEFRQFGRIYDITMQPMTDKEVPRWAVVNFVHLRSATSALNCVHRHLLGSTVLCVSYVKTQREHIVYEWVRSHSKFV